LPQTQVDLAAVAVLGLLIQHLLVLEILEVILPLKDMQAQRPELMVVTRKVKLAAAAVVPVQLVVHHHFYPELIGMPEVVESEFCPP
jgi:uncharacterized protein (DUF111 family)